MAGRAILSIDQGTTNSKAVLVSEEGAIVARGSAPVPIEHPRSGWVQQEAEAIWASVEQAIAQCIERTDPASIAAIGISNQRESVLAWDRASGAPIGPVVTWQCRRTAPACEALRARGIEGQVIERTGLPLDPLFPAPKIAWLLEHYGAGRDPADLCVGTVDSWLIWKMTGGAVHACDRSNASRTQLYDLANLRWSDELCDLFAIPPAVLPEVRDSAHLFGETQGVAGLPDGIAVAGAIGDSHGALFGHGAFEAGDGKATFGTGSSIMTTLASYIPPPRGLTTTIAWSLDGRPTYAFEGNILASASILPWTADLLGLNGDVAALLDLAETARSSEGVTLVPAFVGLGAPHWNAEARAMLTGMSFSTGPAHIALAASEAVALQVHDVIRLVERARGEPLGRLFVDGGASQNHFLMGLVSAFIGQAVITCENTEASALGAAYLAGLSTGLWQDLEKVVAAAGRREPVQGAMEEKRRRSVLADWKRALSLSMFTEGPPAR